MKYFFTLIIFIAGTFLFPFSVVAADLASSSRAGMQLVVTSSKPASVGEEIVVELLLDTDGGAVNALSADVAISFLPDTTRLTDPYSSSAASSGWTISRIRDGDSIVGAWVTKATLNDPAHVSFSGIIPGGATTARGKIVTLYLIPRKTGTINLTVTGTLFDNGASGTSRSSQPNTLSIPIIQASSSQEVPVSTKGGDTTPPEGIRVIIAQNEKMFDGKPFIIINAKDSESGIATYELLETPDRHNVEVLVDDNSLLWRFIDNPAPLSPSGGIGFIYLRVTDREGNAVVVEVSHPIELSPEKTLRSFNKLLLSIILIGAAGLVLWLWYRRRMHHA